MLNDDTHGQHICNSKRVFLCRVALFLLNVPKLVYKFSIFFSGAIIPVHLYLNVI